MIKFYLFGIIFCSFIVSCSNKSEESVNVEEISITETTPQFKKSYGPYIAGRIAHLRKDFNSAANYYIEAYQYDPENTEIVSRLYLLLSSEGRINEAAKYAKIAKSKGDTNNFIDIIISVENIKQGKYQASIDITNKLSGDIYEAFINPLLNSWAYAGLNQPDKALKSLATLKKEPGFKSLYNLQMGMINDYFSRNDDAQKHYEVIINDANAEMSFRALQIISNFYIRTNQKDKATKLISKYQNEQILTDMLSELNKNIKSSDVATTKPLIDNVTVGNSEALFSIAATLRQGEAGTDLAHMFISMSIYQNPKYDLAKLLLADILETREMYADANKIYETIPETSEAYFTAQTKRSNNYVMLEDYESAELLLKAIALDNPKNYQIYLDLGDVLRIKNKPQESIKYYEKAISKISKPNNSHWMLYYALGISYEQNKEWNKAEETFKKSLALSQNHYLVLNYLGYSWLRQNKNINDAFAMIVDAYNQAPEDGNIADSLGWAFYNIGYYDKAIVYLEKSAELEPNNAVISDHLGDAYWFNNRKNEAIFQWNHALRLQDTTEEFNADDVNEKISSGPKPVKTLKFDKTRIEEQIKILDAEQD